MTDYQYFTKILIGKRFDKCVFFFDKVVKNAPILDFMEVFY